MAGVVFDQLECMFVQWNDDHVLHNTLNGGVWRVKNQHVNHLKQCVLFVYFYLQHSVNMPTLLLSSCSTASLIGVINHLQHTSSYIYFSHTSFLDIVLTVDCSCIRIFCRVSRSREVGLMQSVV